MTSRMLKKSASGVLASLRGSTYRSVRLASSLAAALLDGLFEHPEIILVFAPSFPQPVRMWPPEICFASCRSRKSSTWLWFNQSSTGWAAGSIIISERTFQENPGVRRFSLDTPIWPGLTAAPVEHRAIRPT